MNLESAQHPSAIDPYSDVWDDYRRILHIDLDAFFASVEQRDFPELRGKPIAVGLNQARGVVASASYEARKFGVRSAQPSAKAAKLCPELIFVKGRMSVYKEVSAQIMEIFREVTDSIEPLSIDEAYLDVTSNKLGFKLGIDCARLIKERVRKETGLVASAGVSYNKFLAKIASDWKKPDGLCVIHPAVAQKFIDKLPVKEFWGVGPVTQKKMEELGIMNGHDLREQTLEFLMQQFGKSGATYYNFSRGLDDRPVTPGRERKRVSAETTFTTDTYDRGILIGVIRELAVRVYERVVRQDFRGTSLTLKFRFSNFETHTKSLTGDKVLFSPEDIARTALQLFENVNLNQRTVRLIGISVGNRISEKSESLYLPFDGFEEHGL